MAANACHYTHAHLLEGLCIAQHTHPCLTSTQCSMLACPDNTSCMHPMHFQAICESQAIAGTRHAPVYALTEYYYRAPSLHPPPSPPQGVQAHAPYAVDAAQSLMQLCAPPLQTCTLKLRCHTCCLHIGRALHRHCGAALQAKTATTPTCLPMRATANPGSKDSSGCPEYVTPGCTAVQLARISSRQQVVMPCRGGSSYRQHTLLFVPHMLCNPCAAGQAWVLQLPSINQQHLAATLLHVHWQGPGVPPWDWAGHPPWRQMPG